MTNIFSCPVCKAPLSCEGKIYKCTNGHCFDISKEGYVNLLLSGKGTSFSGDDKEMVNARSRFLDGGSYSPLRDCIRSTIAELSCPSPTILDAGCGEGYYTSAYAEISDSTFGIDISKAAIRHAAKRSKNARFAIASVYHLPVLDNSCDVVVNCFSPNCPEEFRRVLKSGGYLIYVVPAPRHLWELKSILYDTPYENEEKTEEYCGFSLEKTLPVTTQFTLSSNNDILSLFHMTPYSWNTPRECALRLSGLSVLTVTADFRVYVYRAV